MKSRQNEIVRAPRRQTIFRTLNKVVRANKLPLPVQGRGARGGSLFADAKLHGYRQKLRAITKSPASTRRKYEITIENARPRRARGVKERKPPGKGGFTPSKQPAGRSLFDAQKSIPRSAERVLGLCPNNPRPFSKKGR